MSNLDEVLKLARLPLDTALKALPRARARVELTERLDDTSQADMMADNSSCDSGCTRNSVCGG